MKRVVFFISIMFLFINVYAIDDATLKNIRVNNKECECIEYKCEMEVDADQVTITYELSNSEATVNRSSGTSTPLSGEKTTIPVTVKHGQSSNVYEFVITKHVKSSDFSLKYLSLNGEEIVLMDSVYVYNASVPFDQEEMIIEAIPNDTKAGVDPELSFLFPLDESSKSLDFTVKAENGEQKNYRIFVTRNNRPDTTLKSLKIEKGNINFDKNINEYNITVEYNITNITVEAIPNDENATVEITKEDLVVGENVITIKVINETANSIYTINVNREPNLDKSQANLKRLVVKEYSKLKFDPNVLEYNLNFQNIPSKLNIEYVSVNEEAQVKIEGNANLKNGSIITINSTIIEDGSEIVRTYTLKINEIIKNKTNKLPIIITLIILIIVIIILLILEVKDRKNKKNKPKNIKKTTNKTQVSNKHEEELEII